MTHQLTVGAIKAIESGQNIANPIVQVMAIKKIQSRNAQNSQDRFRLVISDSQYYQQAMLAVQLNDLVLQQELSTYCIIQLNDYLCNKIQGRSIVIILKLEILAGPLESAIGTPQNIDQISSSAGAVAQPAVTVSQQVSHQQQTGGKMNNPGGNSSGIRNNQNRDPNAGANSGGNNAGQFSSRGGSVVGGHTSQSNSKHIFPIANLNPYQNKWTIRARVTRKGAMKQWKNDKGTGNLFSVDLIDNQGSEIRATCFKELADQLWTVFEEGKVYEISRGQIKFANRKFNPLSHEYEITLDKTSEVVPCDGIEGNDIPSLQFNFVSISQLVSINKDTMVDIIGVIQSLDDATPFTGKSGYSTMRRDLFVVDDSGSSIKATIWGDRSVHFSGTIGSIIAVKGAKLSDYGGKSLNIQDSSIVEFNPDLPDAHRIRGWFDETGGSVYQTLTAQYTPGTSSGDGGSVPEKTFAQVREERLGSGGISKFGSYATISLIPDKGNSLPYYASCPGNDPADPSKKCYKRIIQVNGQWKCDKCDGTFAAPVYRYILSIRLSDHTGSIYATVFDELAVRLLGQPADVLREWKEEGNDTAIARINKHVTFQSLHFKFIAKEDQFQNPPKIKYSVQAITPINYQERSRELITMINQFNQM